MLPPFTLDYHSIDPGSTWRRDRGKEKPPMAGAGWAHSFIAEPGAAIKDKPCRSGLDTVEIFYRSLICCL